MGYDVYRVKQLSTIGQSVLLYQRASSFDIIEARNFMPTLHIDHVEKGTESKKSKRKIVDDDEEDEEKQKKLRSEQRARHEEEREEQDKDRRTRMDKNELAKLILEKFNEDDNKKWKLIELNKELDQPENYLKEVLKEYCIIKDGFYTLKDEFK